MSIVTWLYMVMVRCRVEAAGTIPVSHDAMVRIQRRVARLPPVSVRGGTVLVATTATTATATQRQDNSRNLVQDPSTHHTSQHLHIIIHPNIYTSSYILTSTHHTSQYLFSSTHISSYILTSTHHHPNIYTSHIHLNIYIHPHTHHPTS